ncbi:MAG: recombinase family protein [Clostridiales bacterium]|nr:recombinase family protein [Clostridiales bacterium]
MAEKTYQAASYVRNAFQDLLCPEDTDPPVSEKLFSVQDYLAQFPDIEYKKSVTDHCYSSQGASLRGIERLITLFENHMCNCLLLYSIGEFSDSVNETRYCLLELLPSLSIRVLSACEGYDSLTSGDAERGYPLLENLLEKAESNEDGRKKKIGALRKYSRMRSSRYTCPYGYISDNDDADHFIIEPDAAIIVQRIFSEYLSGKPMQQIAKDLSQEGVLSRSNQKKTLAEPGMYVPNSNYWTSVAIQNILSNEFYTGDLILPGYRKTRYLNMHDTEIYKAAPEMAVRSHHPAIIPHETFDTAQLMLQAEFFQGRLNMRRECRPKPDPYHNLIFCAKCGSKMTHQQQTEAEKKIHLYYKCSRAKNQGNDTCSPSLVPFADVDDAVHAALKEAAALAGSYAGRLKTGGNTVFSEKEAMYREAMDSRIQELRETTVELAHLHVEYMAGRIPADQYYLKAESMEDISRQKSEELLKAMTDLREFRTNYSPDSNPWMQLYHGLSFETPLTPAGAKQMIERIIVSPEEGTVIVKLKCEEERKILQAMLDELPAEDTVSAKEE